ncbi:MAG: hypothetical protein JNL83_36920 [Myxococcales bacterium]|nr:hypothetical protein [Myxococcales bacterium]
MPTRSLLAALLFAPLAIAACASSEAAPAKTDTTKTQASSVPGEAQQLCVETMTKNRTCTDEYIPALVDTRAKLDKPPGIAEKVKADRAAVIAQAKVEWAEDSKDENIARQCQAMTEHMTEDARPMMDALRACLAKDACGDYVPCVQPVFEQLMSGPRH